VKVREGVRDLARLGSMFIKVENDGGRTLNGYD